MRPLFMGPLLALTVCMCHQPEAPPVAPKPTDPTNGREVAFQPADSIDASIIVSDGGRTTDAMPFELDTGSTGLSAGNPTQPR